MIMDLTKLTPEQLKAVAELADIVYDMRDAQREYFFTRDTGALQLAKRAERNVDFLLADIRIAKSKLNA